MDAKTTGRLTASRAWIARSLAATIIATPNMVSGASFDCAKGAGIERIICSSEQVSRLDEALAAAYQRTLRSSADPHLVAAQQRAWLREIRDRCSDEACLEAAYRQKLAQLGASEPAAWVTFHDPGVAFSFSYPSDRRAITGCHDSPHCVALTGGGGVAKDYLVALEMFDGDLEKAAEEYAVFHKMASGWVAQGRLSEHRAEALEGPGWRGLKATVDCGVSDKSGFHAAGGECLWVVLSDGKRAIVADTQGVSGNDEATMRTIESIRFEGN